MITRRAFFKGGIAAFTVSFAAPEFLSDLARAQGSASRNLVVLDLTGGNDGLSLLVPYTDPVLYTAAARRWRFRPARCCRWGRDSSGKALGLHPKLTGLRDIFNQGRLAIIQRAGYENSSRSHFSGTDIWSTANPPNTQGAGWMGRYLSTLKSPLDPLAAWSATVDTPHALAGVWHRRRVGAERCGLCVQQPEHRQRSGARARGRGQHRLACAGRSAACRVCQFHRAGGHGDARSCGRRSRNTSRRVTYPTNGFGQALQAIAGAMSTGLGTKVFFLQTGGFDTHASQDTTSDNGAYVRLMVTLNDGLTAFATTSRTAVSSVTRCCSRSPNSDGESRKTAAEAPITARPARCSRWAGSSVAAFTAQLPRSTPTRRTSRSRTAAADVRFETDFRSVYAKVIDNWLGGDSVGVLGGNFKKAGLDFV